jgi:hypothetical protein
LEGCVVTYPAGRGSSLRLFDVQIAAARGLADQIARSLPGRDITKPLVL